MEEQITHIAEASLLNRRNNLQRILFSIKFSPTQKENAMILLATLGSFKTSHIIYIQILTFKRQPFEPQSDLGKVEHLH